MSESASRRSAESVRVAGLLGSIESTARVAQSALAGSVRDSAKFMATSADSKLIEGERQARQMWPEQASLAASCRATSRALEAARRTRDQLAEQARSAATFAQAQSAASKMTDAPSLAANMIAESTRVADLLATIQGPAAHLQAKLADSVGVATQLTTSLEPFTTLAARPTGMSASPLLDRSTEIHRPAPDDIKFGEDANLAADHVVLALLVALLVLAVVLWTIFALASAADEAWDTALLTIYLIDRWVPHPVISGLVKLNGYISALIAPCVLVRWLGRKRR